MADGQGRLSADDRILQRAAVDAGWAVDVCSWRQARDWSVYSAVIVRSPYDYIREPVVFLEHLDSIDAHAGRLLNPLGLMRWNLDKRYLLDLHDAAIPAIPSVVLDTGAQIDALIEAADRFGSDRLILKPRIGASASGVMRLDQVRDRQQLASQLASLPSAPCLVQPYLKSIETDGEISLIYFNKRYSHAVCKRPAARDFRVQAEHGGSVVSVDPPASLRQAGQALLEAQPSPMLYARVDVVRTRSSAGQECALLMELELIEPELFFRSDSASADRFMNALGDLLR